MLFLLIGSNGEEDCNKTDRKRDEATARIINLRPQVSHKKIFMQDFRFLNMSHLRIVLEMVFLFCWSGMLYNLSYAWLS